MVLAPICMPVQSHKVAIDKKMHLSSYPVGLFFQILHAGKHVQAILLYETSAKKIDITQTMLNVKVTITYF